MPSPSRLERSAGAAAPTSLALLFLLALLPFAGAACSRRASAPPPPAAARHDAPGFKDVEIHEDPVKTGIEAGDAGLAGRVRSRLGGDPQLRGLAIEVDAEGGRVTLWGHVSRAEDRAGAEQLARRTPGVAAVNDLIKVESQAGSRP
jgi:hypothetical protein